MIMIIVVVGLFIVEPCRLVGKTSFEDHTTTTTTNKFYVLVADWLTAATAIITSTIRANNENHNNTISKKLQAYRQRLWRRARGLVGKERENPGNQSWRREGDSNFGGKKGNGNNSLVVVKRGVKPKGTSWLAGWRQAVWEDWRTPV